MDNIKLGDFAVLIPSYEPDERLPEVVRQLNESGMPVIVVDDGSGGAYDRFFDECREYAEVIRYDVNKGKGGALKTGLAYIKDNLKDCFGVVTADSDGQHTPEDIKKVCLALAENTDAKDRRMVLGSRAFDGEVPLRSKCGNTITRIVFAAASGKLVYDTQTGLRCFTRALIDEMLNVKGERFDYEMNVLLSCIQADAKVDEVRITTVYESATNHASHFRTVADAALVYSKIFRYCASSLICAGLDFVMVLVFNVLAGNFFGTELALAVSVVAARTVSSCINFILNRRVVFRSKGNVASDAGRYFLLVICVLAANYLLMWLFNIVLNINLPVSKLITEVILFIANYFIQKKLVFKKKESK